MDGDTIAGTRLSISMLAPLAVWVGVYDELEVHRSTTGEGGIYVPLTAPSWRRPRLPRTAGPRSSSPLAVRAVPVSGKQLKLKLNEATELTILFAGADPLPLTTVASQIIAKSRGLLDSFLDADGVLAVEAQELGNGAILRVLESEAAPLLGLSYTGPEGYAYGKNDHLRLVAGKEIYTFVDLHGAPNAWYKHRLRDSVSGAVSDFFSPRRGDQIPQDAPSTTVGTLQLTDEAGRPMPNREVRVHVLADAGKGVLEATRSFTTDEDGRVAVVLKRGVKITLSIPGTMVVRHITAPMTGDIFDLLSAGVGPDDAFKVQVPDLADAYARRSL